MREYPYLPEAHEQLGLQLQALGRPEEALAAYRDAVRLAVDEESAYEAPIESYLEKLKALGTPSK